MDSKIKSLDNAYSETGWKGIHTSLKKQASEDKLSGTTDLHGITELA